MCSPGRANDLDQNVKCNVKNVKCLSSGCTVLVQTVANMLQVPAKLHAIRFLENCDNFEGLTVICTTEMTKEELQKKCCKILQKAGSVKVHMSQIELLLLSNLHKFRS